MMLQKIKRYFQHGLWDFSLREKKGWSLFFYKSLRIAALSLRGFFQDRCTLIASSMTYYTLMSLVPVLAMAFGIAGGFGLEDYLKDQLLVNFPEHHQILTDLFAFSDKLLERTQGGILAVVSVLLLIWSATLLLTNIENALNHIWGVKKMRSWRRLFSDYFTLMLITPLFFILANAMAVWISQYLEKGIAIVSHGSVMTAVLLSIVRLVPYGMFCVLFALLYLYLPNTKVKGSSAFIGGAIAGTLYLILQWGYIYFQVALTHYGAIYGSLAALPLFLIWVQLNWFLLLLGAEISFAHQTHVQREYAPAAEEMSYSFRLILALWITQISIDRFLHRQTPLSVELLMKKYQVPYSIAVLLLRQLTEATILAEIKGDEVGYIPQRDVSSLRISDVIDALQNMGSHDFPLIPSKAFEQIERSLSTFRDKIEQSEQNRYLKDL